MALSFFHGGQLEKGAEAGEQEGATFMSRTTSDDGLRNTLRLRPQAVRKLHSENTLNAARDKEKADEISLSRPTSQPFIARVKDVASPRSGTKQSRPVTGQSSFTDVSVAPETSKAKPLRILGMKKPSFLNLKSTPKRTGLPALPRPRSSGGEPKSWKAKAALRREQATAKGQADAPSRPKTANQTESPRKGARFLGFDQEHEPHHRQPTTGPQKQLPPRLFVPPKDTLNPSQFLAECLAHVIVGEWLYKDPNKPGILPQANILQRHAGPPPRGATGVPQRRWFRIDPYERQLTWSSKWDSAASAQHKMSRKGT
jgi:hypothetical protein